MRRELDEWGGLAELLKFSAANKMRQATKAIGGIMRVWMGCFAVWILAAAVPAFAQTSPASTELLSFSGNRVFSQNELLTVTEKCLAADPKWNEIHGPETLDYCLLKLKFFLFSKGYLQAAVGQPREETDGGRRIIVPIKEGALFRLGKVTIEGSRLLTPQQLLDMLDLKSGDIAEGERFNVWLYERAKRAYERLGYLQYSAELEPAFQTKSASEGILDVRVIIEEGNQFTLRSIEFRGLGDMRPERLFREMFVQKGDVFNKELFEESVKRIDRLAKFQAVDVEKDVDYRVVSDNQVDLTIHLKPLH
ncbi:MAG TPA: POTRA domain-containing protein [Pyrinomonadaceae bacterium]|nr:POTRA domain-containing protein [Pyrinomonadaceae bacterium]